jgi:hypothetical protein
VASALARRQQQEKQNLESARKADELNTQRNLYSHSCEALLRSFQPSLDQFNREFQFGTIEVRKSFAATQYVLPVGNTIEITFLNRETPELRLEMASLSAGDGSG